jgi:hypothetical protein
MLLTSYIILTPIVAIFYIFPSLFSNNSGPSLSSDGIVFRVAFGVIVIPLIETAIFQWLLIRTLGGNFKLSDKWCVLISATAFGLSHLYSYQYAVFGFVLGLVLAYSFILCDDFGKKPFLSVFMIHASHNAISALLLRPH